MAITVPNTKSELMTLARLYGILDQIKPSKKNGDYLKDDLIVPLRQYLLHSAYQTVPKHLQLIQEIHSPMLAKRIDEVKHELQEEVWTDPNYSFEEKIDGVRCIVVNTDSKLHFFSRTCSRESLLPIEMPVYLHTQPQISEDFIIDCEITSNASDVLTHLDSVGIVAHSQSEALEILLVNLNPKMSAFIQRGFDFQFRFHAFDCLYFNDRYTLQEPLHTRRTYLHSVIPKLQSQGFPIQEVSYTVKNKKFLYSMCPEGVIAKPQDLGYDITGARSPKGWLKIKKSVLNRPHHNRFLESFLDSSSTFPPSSSRTQFENLPNTDTVDAVITGAVSGISGTFSEGLIHALRIAVYVKIPQTGEESLKELTTVKHMSGELREQLTTIINGVPVLNPRFYRQVCELDGTASVVLGLRFDKDANECIMEEETYNKIIDFHQDTVPS